MKDFDIIKGLLGEKITENDIANIDCYVRSQLGIFIPISDACVYMSKADNTHPSYMIVIYFDRESDKQNHYYAEVTSPNTPYNGKKGLHYYCLMIKKEYFEKRYKMYCDDIPVFKEKSFEMCSDILKALNTFAFEYSKAMMNSDITLDAQTEIITHWIIRSIFGETLDLRAVSADYSVARAQHYMEQHYMDNITVSKLASLGYVSASCFNRRFKKEIGITPIEYLIEIRIQRAKTMLRRKNIPVTDVAMRCGFGSNAHFSACFQSRVGISPREYRDKYTD